MIREIQEKLKTSLKPVARLYYKSGDVKQIFIGFNRGMTLDQHKTHLPACEHDSPAYQAPYQCTQRP